MKWTVCLMKVRKYLMRQQKTVSIKQIQHGSKNLDCQYTQHIDIAELEAFFALLYLAGVFATDGTGRDIFRATMSKNRFLFLLAALRYDDANTRDEWKETDPLAGISQVFNKQCCKFRIYMRSKPAKYRLKVLILCDARTHYFVNGFISSGKTKEPNLNKLSVPTLTVLSLIEPTVNSNRNIIADNWFSSIDLVEQLKLKRAYLCWY
ncbi:hypothetical protein PR048_029122 [Dryococelus australis]|uniref:PiggyBac transposable element-derived protein domain-containing protein n=1 Tax=Dryococelus australis TaxID=614101 RepID=A0ABQ9GCH2_9NEOP|nr:hypothetical protein PR048_029122 [Dryococelus australis]